MRTVKEIADLTGVSVRTLQYYDEIGLLKPAKVNDAGYRFYDDAELEKLQQILFFKELDFQLKDIKEIMSSNTYDKTEIFGKQKRLLTVKRDRLNRLLNLLERLEKGEGNMSFKEFDMSEYIEALEQFKIGNEEQVVKHWGSVEKFDEFIQKIKDDETNVAQIAIKQFGSIEKYTEAMKYNLEHFTELMEQVDEIQGIVKEIVWLTQATTAGMDLGEGYWDMVIEGYSQENVKQITEQKYGNGAAEYIARAFCYYFNQVSNV